MFYSQEILDKYNHILNIDLLDYFIKFLDFINNDSNNIINYYSGKIDLNEDSFKKLDNLIFNFSELINLIILNKNQFNLVQDWEILDKIEEIYNQLILLSNISKFLKSSIVKGNFNLGLTIDYGLKYQENLEKVSNNIGNINFQNDWIDLAIKNDLIEEDYIPEGGVLLKVTFNSLIQISDITSVIDNIDNKDKIKGIDIYKILTFENNDLKNLNYDETLNQTLDILFNLKKEDNPEFPDDGYDKNIIGGNLNTLQFPTFFRQLVSLFKKDDSIDSLTLKNIKRDNDSFYMEYEIKIRSDIIINKNIPI